MKVLTAIISILFINLSLLFAEFKVGMSIPLTGSVAEYGIAIKNGAKIAKEDGILDGVKLIWDDNQYKAQVAVSSFNNLTNIHYVNLVYSWGETPLYAISNLAEGKKVPLIAMSFDSQKIIGKKYIIGSINPTDDFVKSLLQHFRKNKIRKIANC